MTNDASNNSSSRRDFVKNSSLIAGGLFAAPLFSKANYFSGSDDVIKVALVGCGGTRNRCSFASSSFKTKCKACGDGRCIPRQARQLSEKIKRQMTTLRTFSQKIDVPEERKFVGFDGYLKAIPLADVVILATPPGFRPIHFEEAIKQNKHVFMEKPVATDPAGIKKVLAAAELAKQKKLNVVVGLQRHYQNSYRELYKRKDLIGDITSAQAWWNNDGVWVRKRQYNQTEMEYQMRNWYYFVWLCGDHICEQHIHNIDVINWFKNGYPVKAQGMGGRQVRKGKDHGEIFDHHYVEFQYADGSILNSQCRHIPGTMSKVDELLIGTKGSIACGAANIKDSKGKVLYQFDKKTKTIPIRQNMMSCLQRSQKENINLPMRKSAQKVP